MPGFTGRSKARRWCPGPVLAAPYHLRGDADSAPFGEDAADLLADVEQALSRS